jgi:hypothetical protein
MKTPVKKARSPEPRTTTEALGVKFTGSTRSQANVCEQWRLEGTLKTCRAQGGYWERKLTEARKGVERQTLQISMGNGASHSILESYVQDVAKAEQMISSFKEQAATLQSKIDSLSPDTAKTARRAERQKLLAGQLRARLEMDRKLDHALEAVRQILRDRAHLTLKMREGAQSLEFGRGLKLDDERFDALLRMLPWNMAAESEKFVKWFMGQDGARNSYQVHGGEFVLRETLASHNAFRSGDCPELTKEEEAEIEGMLASRGPFAPPVEAITKRLGEAVEVAPPEQIQWGLLR